MSMAAAIWEALTPLLNSGDFWVMISFIGLVALLLYFRVPKQIVAGLDQQRSAIAHELAEAARLNDEAQQLLEKHEAKLAAIQSETDALFKAAQQQAQDYYAEQERALTEKIERQKRLAAKQIEQARANAVGELHRTAADLALAAGAQLIADHSKQSALIDQSIAEIERGLQQTEH